MAPRKNFDPNAERDNNDESSLTRVARLTWDVGSINEQLGSINTKLEKIDGRFDTFAGDYVTQKEFLIVRNIVFGMVGIILVGFLSAVAALIYKGGS